MRLTTKVWLVLSILMLLAVAGRTVIAVDREVDQRIDDARRFNQTVYAGISVYVSFFGTSTGVGAPPTEIFDNLQHWFDVGGISMVEFYLPDGTRFITTEPSVAPANLDAERREQVVSGETASFIWKGELDPAAGNRQENVGLAELLRGGEFSDEFWGPVEAPDGSTLGIARAVVGLPGLREQAFATLRETSIEGAVLVLILWAALWVTLQQLVHRPLRALAVAVRRIREGQISMRASTQGNDELGQLASSFNAMADSLEQQATRDSLTGLLNHRYGSLAVEQALQEADSQPQLSVLLADIDGFKVFNDTYGHTLGDEILKMVARLLNEACSEQGGIPCRYGGDEFLVVLPGADGDQAASFARDIATRVGAREFVAPDGRSVPIALSIGVASLTGDTDSKDRLLAEADAAMYEAKRLGKGETAPKIVAASQANSDSMFQSLDSLVQAIQYRDHYTKVHSDVVADYAARLAIRAGQSEDVARALRVTGVLHDVGKLIVPDHILRKPGPLTDDEYEIMKRHPLVGEMLIRETPFVEDVIQAAGCHHERYDGTGYPRGLKAEQIPLLGRIIAIADAYAAMCLDRPYRKALPEQEIVAELRQGAGSQFDPRLVETFIGILQLGQRAA